jgi:hypothetical protein
MNYNEKFWTKINKLKELEKTFKMEKIQKEDTRKIVRGIQICLDNNEILEAGCCLYNRNGLLRFGMDIIIKYFEKTFQKYN